MKSFGLTDKGLVREYNEDHFYRSDSPVGMLPNLYIVADGMGGHNAGDVASKLAVAYMIEYIEKTDEEDVSVLLTDGVIYANEKVYDEGITKDEYRGMGTTLVACSVRDGIADIVNVGDSRLYVVGKSLEQITIDHSIVEELFRAGEITEAQRVAHPDRNIITRAIGAEKTVAVDHFTLELEAQDLLVLCSDGLNKMLEDEMINTIVKDAINLEEIGIALIKGANKLGGKDNVTVLLAKQRNEVAS